MTKNVSSGSNRSMAQDGHNPRPPLITEGHKPNPPAVTIPSTGVRGGYQAPAGGEKPRVPTTGSGVPKPSAPSNKK
jgi:hypothetical protein